MWTAHNVKSPIVAGSGSSYISLNVTDLHWNKNINRQYFGEELLDGFVFVTEITHLLERNFLTGLFLSQKSPTFWRGTS